MINLPRICPGIQQNAHYLQLRELLTSLHMQRRIPGKISPIHICPGINQAFYAIDITILHCEKKRGSATRICRMYIGLSSKQRLNTLATALHGSSHQRRLP